MLLKGKLAEYNIKDAYIIAPNGQKICEFKKHNLHVVGYSQPVHTKLSLDEIKKHLYIDTKNPNVIPYVTSYYDEILISTYICHPQMCNNELSGPAVFVEIYKRYKKSNPNVYAVYSQSLEATKRITS